MSKKNIIFVVSLPRTGTRSMQVMLETLGYECSHAPCGGIFSQLSEKSQFNAFCDTPIFSPNFFQHFINLPHVKFIYINRDKHEWYKSFSSVGLESNYKNKLNNVEYLRHAMSKIDFISLLDSFNLQYDILKGFDYHRNSVFNLIPNEKILTYDFSDGWKTICDFLDERIPCRDIPHLNKGIIENDNTYNIGNNMISNDIMVSVHKNELCPTFMDDYDLLYVGAHDINGKEIYRKDLRGHEIYDGFNDAGLLIYSIIFISNNIPITYTVWPHSASKGWQPKITKGIKHN